MLIFLKRHSLMSLSDIIIFFKLTWVTSHFTLGFIRVIPFYWATYKISNSILFTKRLRTQEMEITVLLNPQRLCGHYFNDTNNANTLKILTISWYSSASHIFIFTCKVLLLISHSEDEENKSLRLAFLLISAILLLSSYREATIASLVFELNTCVCNT